MSYWFRRYPFELWWLHWDIKGVKNSRGVDGPIFKIFKCGVVGECQCSVVQVDRLCWVASMCY